MSSYLRKAIALGPYAYPSPQQNFYTVYQDFTDTGTTWVRFWVQPNRLQPTQGGVNPATNTYAYPDWGGARVMDYVAGLDAQIAAARARGLNIILTFDGYYPQWMNGCVGANTPRYPPSDVSISSPWAQLLYWCAARWSAQNPNNNGAYVNVLEIVNEPNLFSDRPAGQPTSLPLYNEDFTFLTARMMLTAQQIQTNAGLVTPLMGGPAVADHDNSNLRDYQGFTNFVLYWLQGFGFTALNAGNANFVWTQHNYGDMEKGGSGYARQQNMRSMLKHYQWKGYASTASNPFVFITEGGVRYANVSGDDATRLNTMAARTAVVYNAIHNDTAGVGEGLGMMSNFLVISANDPNGDCGLRSYVSPYAKRPSWNAWAGLTTP